MSHNGAICITPVDLSEGILRNLFKIIFNVWSKAIPNKQISFRPLWG